MIARQQTPAVSPPRVKKARLCVLKRMSGGVCDNSEVAFDLPLAPALVNNPRCCFVDCIDWNRFGLSSSKNMSHISFYKL